MDTAEGEAEMIASSRGSEWRIRLNDRRSEAGEAAGVRERGDNITGLRRGRETRPRGKGGREGR